MRALLQSDDVHGVSLLAQDESTLRVIIRCERRLLLLQAHDADDARLHIDLPHILVDWLVLVGLMRSTRLVDWLATARASARVYRRHGRPLLLQAFPLCSLGVVRHCEAWFSVSRFLFEIYSDLLLCRRLGSRVESLPCFSLSTVILYPDGFERVRGRVAVVLQLLPTVNRGVVGNLLPLVLLVSPLGPHLLLGNNDLALKASRHLLLRVQPFALNRLQEVGAAVLVEAIVLPVHVPCQFAIGHSVGADELKSRGAAARLADRSCSQLRPDVRVRGGAIMGPVSQPFARWMVRLALQLVRVLPKHYLFHFEELLALDVQVFEAWTFLGDGLALWPESDLGLVLVVELNLPYIYVLEVKVRTARLGLLAGTIALIRL